MESQKQSTSEAKGFMAFSSLKKKSKHESEQDEKEEKSKKSQMETQEEEALDTSFLQKLMMEEDRFKETLIKMNDKAVQDIQNDNCDKGLQMLERLKKVLEYAAENGRSLDRNMIIVCLYNTACAYQMGWVLEKCAEYIDAVIYNLNQSIKQDEQMIATSKDLNSSQITTIVSIKIRKQKFLLKVYLQCCAVLSQLSKHEEALNLAHKAQKVMISILSHCANYCKETGEALEKGLESQVSQEGVNGRPSFNSNPFGLSFDFYRNLESGATFSDEVPYLKNTMDFAIPFLNSFIATVKKFTGNNIEETLKQTRKLLFNWKNNPENTEKYLRKEFGKANFLKESESKNRSILGLQTTPEWLKNLNIGSFMHMKPLKYKEYAEKRELISELSKESLQEKVIMQSLIYFSTATEIRFLGMEKEPKGTKEEAPQSENLRISEAYHLTAIELVCKYINGVCPYVNHLIASYQKHYNQNLETIPEESFYSLNEEVNKAISEESNPEIISDIESDLKETVKNQKKIQRFVEENKRVGGGAGDQNLYRRGSENIANFFKREKTDLMQRVKSAEKQKEAAASSSEQTKKLKIERSKGDAIKKMDVRAKKIIKESEEAKTVYENSLSSTSLTFGSVLSKGINSPSQNSSSTTKSRTINSSKNESTIVENNESNNYFVKKGFDIPNLGLNKVLRPENKTQILNYDKRDSHQSQPGFRSERTIQQIPSNEVESGPMAGMSERKLPIQDNGQGTGNANFYLYKNLSKFIQNLGAKNGEPIKPKSKRKIEEKFINNPYIKEMQPTNVKKGGTKELITVQQTISSHHFAFGKPYSKETKQENSMKKSIEEEATKYSSISPRRDPKEVVDNLKGNIKQPERNIIKNSLLLSPKTIRQIDSLKPSHSKERMKHLSPRNLVSNK